MGRFFEYWRTREYENYELDWFLGDIKRFRFKYKWIYKDQIWWHDDYIQEPKKIDRVPIRKWCETCLVGDVFVKQGNERDKYLPDSKKIWEYSFYHKYYIEFCFETEEDLSHFLIKWIG